MSRFSISCRNFFVSQCRKYWQVNPSVLCFRNFPVAKNFMDKRGVVSRFSVEIFCLTVEIFRRGILYCCINFGYRKNLEKRGEYQDFPSKTVPKFFVGESFTVALISGTEKIWRRGGVSRFSVENFLSHSAENFRRGILYCCISFR